MRSYYKITFVFGITVDFDDNPFYNTVFAEQTYNYRVQHSTRFLVRVL